MSVPPSSWTPNSTSIGSASSRAPVVSNRTSRVRKAGIEAGTAAKIDEYITDIASSPTGRRRGILAVLEFSSLICTPIFSTHNAQRTTTLRQSARVPVERSRGGRSHVGASGIDFVSEDCCSRNPGLALTHQRSSTWRQSRERPSSDRRAPCRVASARTLEWHPAAATSAGQRP